MTLQQLEYIVALDKYRVFVQAAESCGVTQSTLSSLVMKLEEELDVTIFDRDSRPVKPTEAGQLVINQAKVILYNVHQLEETIRSEKQCDTGEINISICPTITPYITPKLFKYMMGNHPSVTLHVTELPREGILKKLQRAEIDIAIMSDPNKHEDLLEIPLFKEKYLAYVSPKSPLYQKQNIDLQTMPREDLWGLREDINLQAQDPMMFDKAINHSSLYEAGNIPTLMMIVDENGGFTTIPELHIRLIRDSFKRNIRPIVNPEPYRIVSLFVRKDYFREKMLNIIAEAIKNIIPEEMLDEHLVKYPIRL